ncbi:DUF397 domain-containing protein [Streptomyces acidiscabies]|uniref:DUF397 domain-containing protein n=1 Tax=Streptomyces acidiscabies TaxID=42234 RepID=UPI0038F668C1
MNERLSWFKSSYSDSDGGACLEVALAWHKSSYSDSQGGDCLEVATCPRSLHVRDSKLGVHSPQFTVGAETWTSFLTYATNA